MSLVPSCQVVRGFLLSHVHRILVVVPMLLAVFINANAQISGDSILNDLAAHAAAAILTESKGSLKPTRVLVVDFSETHGAPTELGRQLAEEFSNSLSKQSHHYFVVDRGESLRAVADDRLVSDSFDNPDATRCYETEVGKAVAVEGIIDSLSDRLSLGVWVWRIADHKKIFEERITLPLNDQMRALHSTLAFHSDVAPLTGENAALNYEAHVQYDNEVPKAGTNGYSYPACIYCPQAEYSAEASKAKIQGTVLLSTVIGPDGSTTQISVIHGLPCGLNRQAVSSVMQWRFKPATDRAGKASAVQQTIEISFHMY